MKLTVAILILAFVSQAQAAKEKLSAKGGEVAFTAIGRPSLLKIRGKGNPAQGEVVLEAGKVQSGRFEFELNTLDTGIGLRDTHMREKYLQVKEHPKAVLLLKSADENSFNGELTLHGVTKPITGKVTASEAKKIDASFNIKLSEYAINVPKYMGITVADEVEVVVKIDRLE